MNGPLLPGFSFFPESISFSPEIPCRYVDFSNFFLSVVNHYGTNSSNCNELGFLIEETNGPDSLLLVNCNSFLSVLPAVLVWESLWAETNTDIFLNPKTVFQVLLQIPQENVTGV